MSDKVLGALEFKVLSVVASCRSDCYGLRIADMIKEEAGTAVAIGAIYTTLDRLEKKGLLSSSWGEATAARGGRRKRLYKIEGGALAALARTRDAYSGASWAFPLPSASGA